MSIILTDNNGTPVPKLTSLREELKQTIRAEVRQLLIDILADKIGHAMAVAAGRTFWRETFTRNMGAYWGNSRGEADHVADVSYVFLEKAWSDRYPNETTIAYLDAVHVPSPESAAEFEKAVEDAWEVQIEGSQEAMEQNYYGSARTRKGKDIFSSFWQKGPKGPQ